MNKYFGKILLVSCLSIGARNVDAQQPPKMVSIVRSDAKTPVTIEYRSNNEWRQVQLEAGKDATITGDRIRVATTREDKAIITVDLPIQGGKKYRLIWNTQSGIWDFSPSS